MEKDHIFTSCRSEWLHASSAEPSTCGHRQPRVGRRQLSVCVGEAVGVLLPEKENRGRRFLSKQIQLSEEKKKEEHRARIRRGGASSLGGGRGWGGSRSGGSASDATPLFLSKKMLSGNRFVFSKRGNLNGLILTRQNPDSISSSQMRNPKKIVKCKKTKVVQLRIILLNDSSCMRSRVICEI